jgi:DNA-binding transcriptional LysR family regulator
MGPAEWLAEPAVTLRQLRYWVAVVDERSFTAAARQLRVAQPSLSQQVAALEQRLGVRLMERLPGGVKLTQAGEALLPDARAALAAVERGARAVRSVRGLEGGRLEVAALASLVAVRLTGPLKRWHALYPGVTIRVREFLNRHALVEGVAAGVGDIGIGICPEGWGGPICDLGWEEFVVVVPPQDRETHRTGPIALESLKERRWVLYNPQHGLSDLVAMACGRAGFRPRTAVETSQVEGAARLAASGLGPALIPAANVPVDLRRYTRRLDPPVIWHIVAFARNDWSPAASAYLELLRNAGWSQRPSRAVDVTSA